MVNKGFFYKFIQVILTSYLNDAPISWFLKVCKIIDEYFDIKVMDIDLKI